MSLGRAGWAIFLAGLPFSPFLFRGLDLWHMQTAWAQAWTFALFSLSLYRVQHIRIYENKPFAAWILWTGFWFLFTWYGFIAQSKVYPLGMLQGLFHCLVIVLFYMAFVRTWTFRTFETVLKAIAYSGLLILLYCVVQLLNLDQFFHSIDKMDHSDVMVGTIGNPSHLGTHLALLVPVFAYHKGRFWTIAALISGVLVVMSQSVGALLALCAGICWMIWFTSKKGSVVLFVIGITAFVWLLFFNKDYLNPHGRIEAWQYFWKIFSAPSGGKPVTGQGVGFIMEISKTVTSGPIFQWRHVHNEFFQLAIEQGLIGLGIMFWALFDVWKKVFGLNKSREVICLSTILIIFLVNCLVNFPAHLWVTGSFALMAYCGIYVLAGEELR